MNVNELFAHMLQSLGVLNTEMRLPIPASLFGKSVYCRYRLYRHFHCTEYQMTTLQGSQDL
jgi:hypothetical protein